MLCCSSKEEVDKIFNLGRWRFPGHRLFADRWIEEAGISDVCGDRGVVWVLVKGIPIHLRSEATISEIAQCFGPSASPDEFGCNLNEVKVRTAGLPTIPKSIWLRFRNASYRLPVVIIDQKFEGRREPELFGKQFGNSVGRRFTVGKGKCKVRWRPALVGIGNRQKAKGTKRTSGTSGAASGSMTSSPRLEMLTGDKRLGVGSLDGDVSKKLVVEKLFGQRLQTSSASGRGEEARGDPGSIRLLSSGSGLNVVECGSLLSSYWASSCVGLDKRIGPGGVLNSGNVEAVCESHQVSELVTEVSADCEEGHWAFPMPKPTQDGLYLFNSFAPLSSMEAVPDTCPNLVPQFREDEGQEGSRQLETIEREQEPIPHIGVSEEKALNARCLEMVNLFDIRLGNSTEAAADSILETVSEAMSRRRKSKCERELQRIKWLDQEAAVGFEGPRNRSGYVSSSVSNEQS
ncbi:hypothetical protein LINPERPRIM_LOCUS13930 [Linum perenne]